MNRRKISTAVARGYAIGTGTSRPSKILVSNRTLAKAEALRDAFPDLVVIVDDNAEIVKQSNVVFIGLLPNVAAEVLNKMPFRDDQTVSCIVGTLGRRLTYLIFCCFSYPTDHLHDGCR